MIESIVCPNAPTEPSEDASRLQRHEVFSQEVRTSTTRFYYTSGDAPPQSIATDLHGATLRARNEEPLTEIKCRTCGASALVEEG